MVVTKRQALSDAARLYGLNGMLAPVLIVAKLFIQILWQAKLAWDTRLPSDLLHEWLAFRNQLSQLEALRIPRWLGMHPAAEAQLYGFCNASNKAYAAVISSCVKLGDGQVISHLIASKTRVAPMHLITIPRLELNAAHLLVILLNDIRQALHLQQLPYRLWSDSNIVLHWLRKNTSQLKQYVANRVGYIQPNSKIEHWHHIPTKLNPADCASRGIPVLTLLKHPLWWQGPSTVNHPVTDLHTLIDEEIVLMESEFKPKKSNIAQTRPTLSLQTHYYHGKERIPIDLLARFSNLGKLPRTTLYVLRWKKIHTEFRLNAHVSAMEMQLALYWHIQVEQTKSFSLEISLLQKSHNIPSSSKLISLAPFIDTNSSNIFRVAAMESE